MREQWQIEVRCQASAALLCHSPQHAGLYPSHYAPAPLWSAAACMDSSPGDSETAPQCEREGLCIDRAYGHVEKQANIFGITWAFVSVFLSCTH